MGAKNEKLTLCKFRIETYIQKPSSHAIVQQVKSRAFEMQARPDTTIIMTAITAMSAEACKKFMEIWQRSTANGEQFSNEIVHLFFPAVLQVNHMINELQDGNNGMLATFEFECTHEFVHQGSIPIQ